MNGNHTTVCPGSIRRCNEEPNLSDCINQMQITVDKGLGSGGLICIVKTGQVWTITVNRFMKSNS
ncbi:hypothetical protein MHYP_G00121890 [Metynnis hypsauchen]